MSDHLGTTSEDNATDTTSDQVCEWCGEHPVAEAAACIDGVRQMRKVTDLGMPPICGKCLMEIAEAQEVAPPEKSGQSATTERSRVPTARVLPPKSTPTSRRLEAETAERYGIEAEA